VSIGLFKGTIAEISSSLVSQWPKFLEGAKRLIYVVDVANYD